MSPLSRWAPAEWRAFFRFLRQPSLPNRADISLAATARALLPLFALDMLMMIIVLGAIGAAMALGFKLPDHMLGEMPITAGLIVLIVVGAPIAEEILFRGWLSGRLGHFLATIVSGLGAGFLLTASQLRVQERPEWATLAWIGAGTLLVAASIVFLLRRRSAARWFQRHFAWFFYASALLFAAVHLTNFAAAGASPALLALVMPQFALALILGYLRVRRGLMAGAALHMLHNAMFAAVMIAGKS